LLDSEQLEEIYIQFAIPILDVWDIGFGSPESGCYDSNLRYGDSMLRATHQSHWWSVGSGQEPLKNQSVTTKNMPKFLVYFDIKALSS